VVVLLYENIMVTIELEYQELLYPYWCLCFCLKFKVLERELKLSSTIIAFQTVHFQ